MPETLLPLTVRPELSKITLKQLQDFYMLYLYPYEYKYNLDNGITVVLNFELDQFAHLAGLHYIKTNDRKFKKYKGSYAYDLINSGDLTIEELKKVNRGEFNSQKQRLLSTHLIYHIVNNPNEFIIDFKPPEGDKSKMQTDLIMHSDKVGKSLVLGIRKVDIDNNIYICAPNTLLINRNEKYTDGQDTFKINEYFVVKK